MKAQTPKKHSPEHLERLLDTAEELFAQEGFLRLTTDQLAERLHCSKRSLYEVAAGRESFFEFVLQRRTTRFVKALIAQVDAAADTKAAVRICVEAIVRSLDGESPAFLRDIHQFPAAVRMVERFQRQTAAALTRAIKRGERENVFRRIEPSVGAEALLASVVRVIQPDFLADSNVSAAHAVRQVFQIFWCGLSRNPNELSKTRPVQRSASKRNDRIPTAESSVVKPTD